MGKAVLSCAFATCIVSNIQVCITRVCPLASQEEESDDDAGPDDEDLYASASLADVADAASTSQQAQHNSEEEGEGSTKLPSQVQPRLPGSFAGPSVFGSMTLGMHRGVTLLNRAFEQMAVHAQHRRSLARPT